MMASLDPTCPTLAQIELARTVAERHGLELPLDFEDDGAWLRRFLDAFAFDPDSELDVFGRIHAIRQWTREARSPRDMAVKLEIDEPVVRFIQTVLMDNALLPPPEPENGYDLAAAEREAVAQLESRMMEQAAGVV